MLNLNLTDGGGIRGYWSLLALEMLMDCIAKTEEGYSTYHSFFPEDYAERVSQVHLTAEDARGVNKAKTKVDRLLALPRAQRYLPCHYFDYIAGSSTGAYVSSLTAVLSWMLIMKQAYRNDARPFSYDCARLQI